MAQYLNLPNGYSVEIKEGETKEAALARAIANNPKVFGFEPAAPTEQPESGFIPALKSGTSELKAGIAALAGRTGIMDPAAAEQYIREQEEYQRRTFKPTATFGEAPVTKTLELLGGSVPYMAAPIVAGGLAATAPVSAPVATALGLGTAGAVSATQFTGSNIRRQMEGEGAVAPRALMETDIGAAALAAVPQAALDALSFKMLPGIRQILTSVGKDVPPAVAKQIAEQGVKDVAKDYALATGKAMGTEGLTEVGQQFLERMQAGLNLTDAKARDEYFDSLIGGVVLGGVLSPAGRYVERRGEAARQEATRLETAKQVEAQEAQEREAERAFRQTPEGQAQFVQDYETRQERFKELQAVKKPGKDSTPLERAEYDEVKKERSKLGRELFADSTEYRKAVAGAAAFREQQRVAGLTPEGYFLEQLGVPPVQPALPPADDLFDLYTQPPAPPPPDPVDQYTTQQLALAKENTVLPPQANDYAEYLLQNPALAAQIKPTTPMPGLSKRERETVFDLIQLNLQELARKELVPRVEDLAGQIPKRAVGKRKAPDYQAYLEDLERIDYDRREGQTAADIAKLESLRRQTALTDQGEMFGIPAQKTVLGAAPKTRRELLADLRVARAAKDREAAEKIINDLRTVDKYETAQAERAAATREKFVLNGEQREALSAQGYSEEQIDEIESKAQKSIGQLLGVGETPLSVAIQQVMSESRADAFSEIVDLVNRFNRGAAKQEQLNAAKERVVAGLLADIQQSRGTPLADDERRDITRRANELLRELVERWGDTRTLSQKGKDVFVPAQTRTGEFRTEKVPGAGFPTVEAQMAGRQTFGKPFAAAESIREGLEALRTEAVTATQAPSFTRAFTPEKIRAEAVETQLSRELAKDPKTHSPEQRRLLEAVADNLRMMLRPEVRQDTSAWLYELARDPKNVPTDRTQAIRDALQRVEQAKLSDQEQLGLPLGPGKKLQQVELQGPKKPKPITTGAFSQISFEPEYEEVTSPVFGSYAELKQYLASDALQEMRSSLGLGRPTIARLEQRLQPFIERVNAAKTKAAELSEKAQLIEQQKRQQLETLRKMSEQDLEKEARALNVARETLGALQARVRELEAPLIKELQPFIKEFDRAQKQFETAVAAQEKTIAAMENNTNVFANREIAAIERLHAVQRRMKAARSKIYKGFLEDFGADPANLARTMRDFKASGQQGAFNEQLQKAHNELNAVFFETRGEDQVIQSFLNQSFKLQLQLQEQANKIDALAVSLLDAALNLDVVSRRQLEIAENRDEILDTRTQTEKAKAKVRELTAKQQERLEAVRALEAELGLDRQEIPHRIREDVTVAEVLRASTDTEKALVNQLDAAVADLNEAAQSVKALRVFDRTRTNARAKKPETDQQRQDRDAQRQRLLEAIGRDPNSFEGERISTEKRRQLLDELEATEETREGLEAIIAAADSAIPAVKAQIEKAGSEIKTLDKEIAQLEAKVKKRPRSFVAKLEQNSATITLNTLLEARGKLAKSLTSYPPNTPIEARTVRSLADDLAAYEREKAAAESSLLTLDERKKELEALFSTDPEIRNARVEALDKRIAKVETNIKNQIEGLKEKGLRKTTRESREKELRKYKKELRDLMTQRSAKFGIERKAFAPKPVAQPVEAGERLAPRKVGPLVRPTRTAGNVRTGVLETAGERKLSTRSKIGQTGKPKEAPQIEPIEVKGTAADRIMGELDALERVRQTAESRKNVARDAGDLISEAQYKVTLGRIDAAIAEKQKELKAAQPTKGKTRYQVATEINELLRVEVDPTQSAAALMATVAKDSKTPLNRAVAERLKGLLGATEVRIVKDLRNDAGGAAFGAAGVDGSYIALDADSGLNEQTILHEGVHAAVERTLRKSEVSLTKNQLAAKRELEALYEAYAADAAAPNENAKESLSEFVADALSDPAVQLYMQTKKWTLKNMWNAFKNSILKIIGVDTPTTMLEATLAAADALMLTVPRPTQATTERLFQSKPVYANAEMARVGQDTDKFVAKQRSLWEKIKMNTTGLAFATQLVDRFAGFERLAKYMDSLKGSQMLYYLRMYDQRMNFVSDAVENGAPAIVEKTRPDGRKEYVIETKPGRPSISGVVKTLRAAQPMVGNAEAVNRMFTMYLAALRADRVGLEALNFGKDVTQEMLTNAKRVVEGNAALKDVFTKARNEYNAYNRNMMEFLASTGALSEEVANNLARTNDYIPFYREQDGNAMLIIGGESPMRIGSIAEQPYLKELVGGDTAILDFLNSSVQNTNMLVDMGLRNLATKNAIFELINLNAAKIVKGRPDGPDVVRFKLDGRDVYAVVDTETVKIGGQTFNTGVPADLLVKGMEGIPTQMPFVFRAMAMPAQLLRKAVTLSPIYMAKQLVRDSLSAAIVAGADFVPVAGSLRQLTSTNKQKLRSRGVTGGQYFTGTSEDISKILRDVADGKPGWMSALGKLEAFGMEIDATTRRAQYNSYVEQGMSEMEATLLALESMNFNKRGASPSIHIANALIPFLNAQIQGLNVIYRAVTGQLPFSDKLKVQQKLLLKGGLLAGATLVYAAMMEDDEAYANATPDQKYGNWFIRIPGFDEPVRVPVPFEIGYVFKALPEALYNTMTSKYGGEDAVKAFKQILLQTIPGGSSYGLPQALKPAIEAGLGKSFYTGRDILSAREKELLPEEQFRANTAEISKLFGKAFNISPVTFEYLVRGYTGTLGLAFLHTVSLGAPKSESPEAAVKRLSEYPLVGGVFQPNDAGGIINAVYERFNEDIKVRNSYMDMLKQGRTAEANNLLQRRSNEILEAEIGDAFKSNMTKLTHAERAIVASSMTAEEKRKRLDEIRKIKTGLAKSFREAAARAVA